jgi:cyclopropane-fatty-acyl-phospholipid synthase
MSTKGDIRRILSQISGASFAVRFWDGDSVRYGEGPEEFVLHLKDEAVGRSLLGNLDVRFAEAYVSGAIDVQGDLQRALRLMFLCSPETFSLSIYEKVKLALLGWRRVNEREETRRSVSGHYDLGNEFFKVWLGKEMVYSCAYFRGPEDDIDAAQERKLRHICTKLRLREGTRLMDIGCGWGGLLVHAAKCHGAVGVGVTLSKEQVQEARERIAIQGLSDQIEVELRDYREIAETDGFDRIVSIGMFEHVGKQRYPEYFRQTARLLKAGGVGVLHTVGRHIAASANPWLTKYIFPGTYFPSLAEIAEPLAESGLKITDVEVWRMHYAFTLDRWLEACETNASRIRELYGDRFMRMWRLYLASCAAGFRYGDFCVWQIQFTKGATDEIPLTRDYLYSSRL